MKDRIKGLDREPDQLSRCTPGTLHTSACASNGFRERPPLNPTLRAGFPVRPSIPRLSAGPEEPPRDPQRLRAYDGDSEGMISRLS